MPIVAELGADKVKSAPLASLMVAVFARLVPLVAVSVTLVEVEPAGIVTWPDELLRE